jgi:DNA-binding CsgD family transcriptional regulator
MRKHYDTYLPPGFYSEVIRNVRIEQTEPLTPREIDVLACVYMGIQDRHIKALLSIEESVVQSHLSNARSKLGINSKRDVAGYIKTSGKSHIFETHYKNLYSQLADSSEQEHRMSNHNVMFR